jgi:hypothetical protein
MKLTREQVSNLQQAAWAMEQALAFLHKAGFDYQDAASKKVRAATDEVYRELDTYEIERA